MSPIPDPEIPVVPGPSDFVPDTPTFNLDFVGGAQLEKILISTVIAVGGSTLLQIHDQTHVLLQPNAM